MSKYKIKKLSALLVVAVFMGMIALPIKAEGLDDRQTVYDKNGLRIWFERLGALNIAQDKATPFRSGGPDGKERLDSLTLYEQSTYRQHDD